MPPFLIPVNNYYPLGGRFIISILGGVTHPDRALIHSEALRFDHGGQDDAECLHVV